MDDATARQIRLAEARLSEVNFEREVLSAELLRLRLLANRTEAPAGTAEERAQRPDPVAFKAQSQAEKMLEFRRLFRGRDDVYARRWDNPKSGKSGYSPACRYASNTARQASSDRIFLPLTDAVIRSHLLGRDENQRLDFATEADPRADFTIGIYPLLRDETCCFIAADFDKKSWTEDVTAYLSTCTAYGVPACLERSRSGSGGHVWIFFTEAIPASSARKMAAFLLTQTMERRPEIGLGSYDRFFPNQDTMPSGGLGNLIALPLQRRPRQQGNSVFVDDSFEPYQDQMAFLSTVKSMSNEEVVTLVDKAERAGKVIGIPLTLTDDEEKPWKTAPSRSRLIEFPGTEVLPAHVTLTLGNQIYIPKDKLPAGLVNHLIRLAAFQNPEFYKAQAMRFSTFGKPRIVACAEDFPEHIGLPRGCLDDVLAVFETAGISTVINDERVRGLPLSVEFHGTLRAEQRNAVDKLLEHNTGVLAATTAFGKTVIAAELIARRDVSTLILVNLRSLLDQWVARLSEFLNVPPKEIGVIGAGMRRPTGKIDVAIIQTLCRKGVVDDLVGDYGHLIVDECHHVSAYSFEQVARRCKAQYVTGLTATAIRKDGHQPIIFMQCGPIRHQVNARQQAAIRPFDHRVVVRQTVFADAAVGPTSGENVATSTIQQLYASIGVCTCRNEQIVADVKRAVLTDGRFPVVITERTAHLELLADLLRPAFANVIVMKGGMGIRQRRLVAEQLAGIAPGEPGVLLGTGRYLGEGFDEPRLDTLFLTMPISWRGTLAQYAGRLHRLCEGKTEVIIYDYADLNVPMLARMHEKRLRGYNALGYRITDAGTAGEMSDGVRQVALELS